MDPYALKTLNAERRARRAAILVTDLGDGRDRIVREGDPVAGDLGAAIAKAFRT
ncbi:XdhC family protein, partial [Mesorhizobium sp. M7D.F.Ca.US.004.03.1.1]